MSDDPARPSTYPKERRYDRVLFFFKLAFGQRRLAGMELVGYRDDGDHTPATFTFDGVPFRVEWKHNGSSSFSDRAEWDDGWWPTFFVLCRRRHGFIPWQRDTWAQVYWASGPRTLASQLEELGL